ncbi:MAG TPA: SMP-30/gluconolactonase/LRE family protein [Chitinophagaceae bacterium]|jgi:gluconolactonase|nr:SMP-30/gluconolactonase/LRE family protein [Chitinophagaceae bacterium]
MNRLLLILPFFLLFFSCNEHVSDSKASNMKYKTIGTIEKIDEALDSIVNPDAKAEIIAEGFDWSEGPVWIESEKMLLFSDVPQNTIYKWTEENGREIYLTPSGYTDSAKRGGEMGSNGLLLDAAGRLVLCQHGNRQMAMMDGSLNDPKPNFISIANNYMGKKFNSPNDAVYNSTDELFFTDPPYGLEKQMEDSKKELPHQGVYKVRADGKVILLTDSLTRPNGIAFLPGEKTLIVANSDPEKPFWYAFDVGNDSLTNARIFCSAQGKDSSAKGLPDGLKVDKNGNVFASGPGGIWILNKEGKLLGKIKLTEAASNCALSPDQKTLYITNDMYVLRVKMR